jgi:hypothetical protein
LTPSLVRVTQSVQDPVGCWFSDEICVNSHVHHFFHGGTQIVTD